MSKVVYIYGLKDPRTEEIRYVGKSQNPRRRLNEHVYDKSQCHRANWIRSLLSLKLRPILAIIEEIDDTNWKERECFWIQYYRSLGFNLTNGTDGGDGMHNPTPELRAKIGNSNRGKKRSAQTRANISAALKGRIISEYTIARAVEVNTGRKMPREGVLRGALKRSGINNPNFGKTWSQEKRDEMSERVSGENHPLWGKKHKPESILKMQQAQIGKVMSGETRAKISNSTKGKPKSEETVQRMLAAWEKRKAKKAMYRAIEIGNNIQWLQ